MPLLEGVEQINTAYEKDTEARLHSEWVVQLPFMSGDNYESFSDYVGRRKGKNIDNRPTEVIMKELDEIEKMFGGE